jgi:parallel beta-helix repeat protein
MGILKPMDACQQAVVRQAIERSGAMCPRMIRAAKTPSAVFLLVFCLLGTESRAQKPAPPAEETKVHVGITSGDIRGNDHRALQAAVDYAAKMGGGTVLIGPGSYQMRNALVLRDNVRVIGVPGKTNLVACDGIKVPLTADGDCNERQITLADASGFQVGDGVAIHDEHYRSGFEVTTATLIARVDDRTFRISSPLYLDYLVSRKAVACLAFPLVSGSNIKNAVVEGLTIEGNGSRAEYLDGCRGGGIYLFDCENVTIRNCIVRHYKGDGISFQTSQHVTVMDCLCEDNFGLGLHPGSGSQHPVVRYNRSIHNGGDGLFVCWRVQHGLFEKNEVRDNQGAGVSIGHKDSDNVFRGNEISGNVKAGVLFREESQAMGAHRNVFENNRIVDNGLKEGGLGVLIRGHHDDLVFRKNTIGTSQPSSTAVGIRCEKKTKGLETNENEFVNLKVPVDRAGK